MKISKKKYLVLVFFLSLILDSCVHEVAPVNYGEDPCAYCEMTIMDERYASAILDGSNTIKFDDLSCLLNFAKENPSGNYQYYVSIYNAPLEPMALCEEAFFVHDEIFPSPMNGGYAAFRDEATTKLLADSLGIPMLRWKDIPK